jgi:diacylglycerol kinase family enzyme
MRVLVLLNEAAGTLAASQAGDEAQRIRAGFEAAGVDAEVRSVPGAELDPAARRAGAEGFDAVVAGGGDGTLNTIANALAGGPVAFGVLPLGTHNHFAKELELPLDLDAAVAALARGSTADLDVGEVNGRIFLNFSGLGLHPIVVKHRDAQRETLGRKKFVAMFFALVRALRRMPVLRVKLRAGDSMVRRITPSVIVCNNAHQMEVFGVAQVSYPDRGVLNVYLAHATKWYGVVWLILRAAFRRLETARNFESLVLPEFRIETRRRHARVSIDGEVTDLRTPLHYRVRRGGLKVIVPARARATEGVAGAAGGEAGPVLGHSAG